MTHNAFFNADESSKLDSKWEDIGHYVELLAKENESLEKDLIEIKRRRKDRILAEKINSTISTNPVVKEYLPDNYASDFNMASDAIQQISTSFEEVKSDLKTILHDLQDFRKARSVLESHLFQNT